MCKAERGVPACEQKLFCMLPKTKQWTVSSSRPINRNDVRFPFRSSLGPGFIKSEICSTFKGTLAFPFGPRIETMNLNMTLRR